MPIHETTERRSASLNIRVPPTLKASVEGLARAWQTIDRIALADEQTEVSVSDVVIRLLGVILPKAWEELGGEPKTDAEWREFEARQRKTRRDR